MRIGVFSDTHGDISPLCGYTSQLGRLDALFHLGDFASDAPRLGTILGCPYYAVRGNCDFMSKEVSERIVELGGKRFYLTHGHQYSNELSLAYKAIENRCDAILFGHSHTPQLTAHGAVLICNPGSLSRPRYGQQATCSLITIENGELYIKMLSSCSSGML
ncbi:MAG: metallophosphoesterase [Eubacteriales bacterium]|nr:metallophosphoesterase [Eubacteriales bacterium]